jgi:hypothetical protein
MRCRSGTSPGGGERELALASGLRGEDLRVAHIVGEHDSFTEAKQLNAIEPSINYKNTDGAELAVAKGTTTTYELIAVAPTTKDKFTIKHNAKGEITRECTVGVSKSESSTSW